MYKEELNENLYTIYTSDGKSYIDVKELPGQQGVQLPRRLTTEEMTYLTKEYGVEFAQVYEYSSRRDTFS